MSPPTCYFGRQSRPFRNFSPKMSVTTLMRFQEFEGSIKEKGCTGGFFTMEDKKQSCNGIITFEEAYRYQKS